MPIPEPRATEDEGEYVGRCIAAQAGDDMPDDQKAAICYGKYRESLAGQRADVAARLREKGGG